MEIIKFIDMDKITWPNKKLDTVISEERAALGLDWDGTMETSIINDYYTQIESYVKRGNKITRDVFNSFEYGQKRHFLRTYGDSMILQKE